MRHMAKVWMRTRVFIACGLRSVHGARTRWTLLAPSVGWGWQGLLCTVLCGLEDVSKSTGICHSRRCLTHSVRCHCHVLYDHPERNVLKILKIANKEILRTDGKTDVLMTCVALSQKNNDKWSYLPQLKKMRVFCFILCCEVSWGCSFWFFESFFWYYGCGVCCVCQGRRDYRLVISWQRDALFRSNLRFKTGRLAAVMLLQGFPGKPAAGAVPEVKIIWL